MTRRLGLLLLAASFVTPSWAGRVAGLEPGRLEPAALEQPLAPAAAVVPEAAAASPAAAEAPAVAPLAAAVPASADSPAAAPTSSEHAQPALDAFFDHAQARAALFTDDPDARPGDVFEAAGVGPAPGQTIVFAPRFVEFLGDSLLMGLGHVAPLHERFPESKIRVLSPYAPLLRPQPWLEPVHVTAQEFRSGSALKRIAPGDFLLYEKFGMLDKPWKTVEAALAARGSTALGYNLGSGRTPDERPYTFADLSVVSGGVARERDGFAQRALGLLGTIYEERAALGRLLLGGSDGLSLPLELFADPPGERPRVQAYLEQALPGRAGKPYAVLNLNTKADWKLTLAARGYVRALQDILDMALARDPELNVLVTAPEEVFGPTIAAQAREIVAARGGRVAFMPDDKTLWLPLIHGARYALTQDSGFTHMALIAQPPERVFTFSRHSKPDYWRKPGQPFYLTPDGQRLVLPDLGLYEAVVRWLTSQGL